MEKRGFTLIELSIVLVIIGLLIGGVLVAQSMIHTAKVLTFVKQIQQYDIAVSQFKKKMKTLPGDSTMMGCYHLNPISMHTCDDGWLSDGNVNGNRSLQWADELKDFWVQLQMSGFNAQGPKYIDTIWNYWPLNINPLHPHTPSLDLGRNTSVIPLMFPVTAGYTPTINWNLSFYMIADFRQSTTDYLYDQNNNCDLPQQFHDGYCPSIPVADALAIDLKIDDGLPDDVSSNGVLTMNPLESHKVYNANFYLGDQYNGTPAGQGCTYQYRYNVSDSDATCALMLPMGAQSSGV